jgi:hypothetical protein
VACDAEEEEVGTGARPPPSGWYQDPWGPPGASRYWSGSAWRQQVVGSARFPEPDQDGAEEDGADEEGTGGRARRKRAAFVGAGGLALAVLVAAAVVVLGRSQDVSEISTPVLGVSFTSEQVQLAQPELTARLADLERHASEDPPDVPATAVDLTGTWWSAHASYTIAQHGAEVVVQEINAYGTTGIGYGVFDGRTVQIQYEAVDGSTGFADFTLRDANTLTAVFRNATHQVSVPAVLTRS